MISWVCFPPKTYLSRCCSKHMHRKLNNIFTHNPTYKTNYNRELVVERREGGCARQKNNWRWCPLLSRFIRLLHGGGNGNGCALWMGGNGRALSSVRSTPVQKSRTQKSDARREARRRQRRGQVIHGQQWTGRPGLPLLPATLPW